MPLDNVVFWVFAPISIASAVGMLVMRNAIHAALFLVVNLFCIAVMFLLLDASFLFAVQIVVYAGAIMVLFLFVIMLLGVDSGVSVRERLLGQRPLAIALAVAFIAELFVAVRAGIGFATHAPPGFEAVNQPGNTQALSEVLFREYFFPFEVTSVLLIVAAIAAMVLARRQAPAVTQAELEAHRAQVTDELEHAAAEPPA
ncbi:MAG TPA: NADH-quinone oxidoreductase subunit J [Actinomycetota bacterium]|jgi:NADH-quinone oxidoreductase subunit J